MCDTYIYKCTGMLQLQIARNLAPEAETERSLQLSRGQRSEAGGPELEGVQCGHGEGPIVLLCLPWSVSFHSHSCCLIITRWGLLHQAYFHLSGRKKGKSNSSRCLLYQESKSFPTNPQLPSGCPEPSPRPQRSLGYVNTSSQGSVGKKEMEINPGAGETNRSPVGV